MDDDPRPDCRYGSLCYQKNPEHHAKFKHIFKRKERTSDSTDEHSRNKKMKQSPKPRTSDTGSSSRMNTIKHVKADTTINNKKERYSKTSPSKAHEDQHTNEEQSDSNQKESKNESIKVSSCLEESESSPKKKNSETKKRESSSSNTRNSELNKQEIDSNEHEGDENTDSRASVSSVVESKEEKCEAGNSTSPKKRASGSSSHNNSEMNDSKEHLDKTLEINDSIKKLNTSGDLNINNVLIEDVAHMKSIVKEKYLVQMPEEFFTFWKLCQKISPKNPTDAFVSLDLKLVGPFDVMNGKVVDGPMVTHWRFFYDPPELQTIVVSTLKNQEELHYGYFRDCPDEDPVFIASNTNKDCKINPVASNIFTFIHSQIEEKLKLKDSPKHTSSLQQKLKDFAHSHKIDLETPKLNSVVRARTAKTVCKSLLGVGIVVPYVKKSELGYRPLQKTNKELENLFRQFKDPEVEAEGRQKLKSILQEVSTWVTIAVDESDFGTGLEFGLDLFGSGIEELHGMAKCTLGVAYQYLYREEFGTILEAHLTNRNKNHVNLLE
uniref:UPF0609 protein C4orf27 homolog n=1 Tax=Cacopsylla melanoneura TaxID=428564 RepID=A0A8D8WVB4_9HEMI